MVRPDPRRVVGAKVTARATYVSHPAECNRRYGSLAKSKWLVGTVLQVVVTRATEPGKRSSTKIMAEYELGGGQKKVKTIALSSVKAWMPPSPKEREQPLTPQQDNHAAPPIGEQAQEPTLAALTGETNQEAAVPAPPLPQQERGEQEHSVSRQQNQPAAVSNGVKWYEDDHACCLEINLQGSVPGRQWAICQLVDQPLTEMSVLRSGMSRLDFFC